MSGLRCCGRNQGDQRRYAKIIQGYGKYVGDETPAPFGTSGLRCSSGMDHMVTYRLRPRHHFGCQPHLVCFSSICFLRIYEMPPRGTFAFLISRSRLEIESRGQVLRSGSLSNRTGSEISKCQVVSNRKSTNLSDTIPRWSRVAGASEPPRQRLLLLLIEPEC